MPRLCAHTGFGLRDLHRVLSGPAYARRWVDRAVACGRRHPHPHHGDGLGGARPGRADRPRRPARVDARAVVLATGARERSRAARLVPGTRPAGVFTTGQLQQMVHREQLPVGRRAIVVGAEHVSYQRGADPARGRRAHRGPRHRPPALADLPPLRSRDPRSASGSRSGRGTTVAGVYGRDRVDRVLLRGPGGEEREVAVDTVVFSGDFIPDSELARVRPGSPSIRAPAVPPAGPTARRASRGSSRPATSCIPSRPPTSRPAGRLAAGRAAAAFLRAAEQPTAPPGASVAVRVADPLHWVVPNIVDAGTAELTSPSWSGRRAFLDHPRLHVTQGGQAPGLPSVAPHDPEPVAPDPVGVAATGAARGGRRALGVSGADGRG